MKNLRMSLSGFAILAIVGSALAFNGKARVAGDVWCFTSTPNPDQSCSSQDGGVQPGIIAVTSGGSTANLCPAGTGTPFIPATDECNPPPVGQQYQAE